MFFEIDAPCAFFAVKWEAKDALQYFGSVLGGIGTIFLGLITIKQTKQIKDNEIDRENANVKRPFFIIKQVLNNKSEGTPLWNHGQNGFSYSYNKHLWSFVEIHNVGDGVANNLIIEPWGFGEIPKEQRPSFCIPSGGYCRVPINLPFGTQTNSSEKLCVIYENLIGYAYSQEIELFIQFSPKTVCCETDFHDESYNMQEEEYKAQVFNIYPQVAHGMNKYNIEDGRYVLH